LIPRDQRFFFATTLKCVFYTFTIHPTHIANLSHVDHSSDPLQTDQQALLAALQRLLEPLATLCLAKGVTIQSAEELLRTAFVKAARQACEGANPDRLTSRISTMTGLTRREVSRLESQDRPALPMTRSSVTEALTLWVSQPGYTDAQGHPLTLPRQGQAPSFEALARGVTQDVHPRSLLEEMVRLKLVEHQTADDTVALLQNTYVPRGQWSEMLGFLGSNVGDHLHAAVTNVLGQGNEHFEQALLADELSAESAHQARQLIAAQWRELMTTLGPQLQALMDADQASGRTQDQAIRIGLYSWTHPMPTPPAQDKS
jgi:DNA-directed RNA polymerase specialized sigma24 family protein